MAMTVEPEIEAGVAALLLKSVRVDVRLVTDHPPNVVREARVHLLRAFETKQTPVELSIASEVGVAQKKSWKEQGQALLTLLALTLGALSLMALAGAMIARAWRREAAGPAPGAPAQREPGVAHGHEPRVESFGLPALSLSPAFAAATGVAPPPPPAIGMTPPPAIVMTPPGVPPPPSPPQSGHGASSTFEQPPTLPRSGHGASSSCEPAPPRSAQGPS